MQGDFSNIVFLNVSSGYFVAKKVCSANFEPKVSFQAIPVILCKTTL